MIISPQKSKLAHLGFEPPRTRVAKRWLIPWIKINLTFIGNKQWNHIKSLSNSTFQSNKYYYMYGLLVNDKSILLLKKLPTGLAGPPASQAYKARVAGGRPIPYVIFSTKPMAFQRPIIPRGPKTVRPTSAGQLPEPLRPFPPTAATTCPVRVLGGWLQLYLAQPGQNQAHRGGFLYQGPQYFRW